MADFIIIKKDTGEIINYNATYPRADFGELIGADPNLEYLKKYTPFQPEPFDSRVFKKVETQTVTTTPHPDLPQFNQYLIEFAVEKRANEEIILSIENEEINIKSEFLTNPDVIEVMLMMLTALWNKTKGMTLTALEQTAVDNLIGLNVKLLQNKEEKAIKTAQVLAGQEPDLDSGWVKKV